MPSADPIEQARTLLQGRLADIEEERKQLERALAGLGGGRRRPRGARGEKARASARPASSKESRRRRKGARRDEEVLKAVTKRPGSTATDIAKKLKVKPNYLYKVIRDLEKDGKLKKEGRQLFPKG